MRTGCIIALLYLSGITGSAQAQFGLFSSGSSSTTQPVGQKVGTPVGAPIASTPPPFGNAARPIGPPVDTSLSVAPILGTQQGESFFTSFYNSLASLVPFTSKPKQGNTTGWFPSLGRRNRERHKAMPVWLLD